MQQQQQQPTPTLTRLYRKDAWTKDLWDIMDRYHEVWCSKHNGRFPGAQSGTPGRDEVDAWLLTQATAGRNFEISQVKPLYREYKVQRTAALPPNGSAPDSDDYLVRLAARFEAVAADAADDAAHELATVHAVSTSAVAYKLFAYVIGQRESDLAEEAEKWIRGGMYDAMAANRPDNASSSRDKDRAIYSSQWHAATEAALQWAKPGPLQPPVAAYIIEQFRTRGARPVLVDRSAQTVCQALHLLACSSLRHHLSAFDAPPLPPAPSPGPESKVGS